MNNKIFILLFVFLTSCKDEKPLDSLEVVKPQKTESFFKVSINFIATKDDDFSLYYTEDETTNFKIAPIWKGIMGRDYEQTVSFDLPENIKPSLFRIDFGMNKDQEDVVLKSVTMEYKGKKKEIIGVELANFFRADDNKCTFDAQTGIIKPIIKDGVKQFPSLYPHESTLIPEIQKVLE